MMNRLIRRTLACCLTLGLIACGFAQAGPVASRLGEKVADFSLKDQHGRVVSLKSYKDRKAVVVIFLGTECPINNAFLPHLGKLHERYAAQGVQFVGINSNEQDTAERVAEHARRFQIPFPVLKDPGNVVADQFAAQRTPEAFVLDADRKICYQGRIDDQFGIGYKRANKPTREDLVEALDEVLADDAVTVPATPAAGCLIARSVKRKTDSTVTFARDVVRLLQDNCQECHRPGQIGPMALFSYEDAKSWSATIREVITDQRMPPWYADPRYGHFSNDRRLSPADRDLLLAWIDQGCAPGDLKTLPPPRQFPEGWVIGKPDVIFTMDEDFVVPADTPKGGIEYQNIRIKTNFAVDRWVVGAEARPGNAEVVHHIVVFVVPPGFRFVPKLGNAQVLCGTAPGDMPLMLSAGMAKKVPAGSDLVLQMHYTPNGTTQRDRSSVGLIFAREPPQRRVLTMPIGNPTLRIPAGDDNYQWESSFTMKQDGQVLSFMPHMHLRGKDFLYEVIYPDGRKETLLSVPRYNFNWQSVYRLAEPVSLPEGSKIHCVAHFDNSAKNPNNPDPTKSVRWGDQTWEEMMIGWIDYVYDRKAE